MNPVIARDDKRVRGYFEASARDLTPINMRPAVHVLYVPVSTAIVNEPEAQRAWLTM